MPYIPRQLVAIEFNILYIPRRQDVIEFKPLAWTLAAGRKLAFTLWLLFYIYRGLQVVSSGRLTKPLRPFGLLQFWLFLYVSKLRYNKYIPTKLFENISIDLLPIFVINGDFYQFICFIYSILMDRKDYHFSLLRIVLLAFTSLLLELLPKTLI